MHTVDVESPAPGDRGASRITPAQMGRLIIARPLLPSGLGAAHSTMDLRLQVDARLG